MLFISIIAAYFTLFLILLILRGGVGGGGMGGGTNLALSAFPTVSSTGFAAAEPDVNLS
jgi:hypothetical protein